MSVGDEEQMKNKEEAAPRTTLVLSVSNGQRGGEGGPINRSFSTGSGQNPVLKGHPLAPVCVPSRCQRLCLVALAGAKGDPLAPVGNTNRC